jgi:hypothetical protein
MNWLPDVLGALALALIMLLGFAAQRAGACTVNAVAEVMTTGSARLLASFVKAALWAAAVYGLFILLGPTDRHGFTITTPPAVSLLGAFVFGVGTAINGACAMSTMQRLADGDLGMALTLVGIVLGLVLWITGVSAWPLTHARELPLAWNGMGHAIAVVLVAVMMALALVEAIRLWRTRPRDRSLVRLAFSPAYRLSTAALVIGICGGLLIGIKGAWSYTNYLRKVVGAVHENVPAPGGFELLLLASLFAGMLLSALLRRTLRVRLPPGRVCTRRFVGGVLMGFGAGAIPGGNDALLLTGLPTLSLWAIGTYVALIAGVAVTLLALRASGMSIARVSCAGDVCRADAMA